MMSYLAKACAAYSTCNLCGFSVSNLGDFLCHAKCYNYNHINLDKYLNGNCVINNFNNYFLKISRIFSAMKSVMITYVNNYKYMNGILVKKSLFGQ